jgi:hypothetical protein
VWTVPTSQDATRDSSSQTPYFYLEQELKDENSAFYFFVQVKVKVEQSLYKSGQALRVPGG